MVAFAAVPEDLTVGSVPTALVAVAVAFDPDLVGDACTWSLAYVVWPTGVDDTGRRVDGVTVVEGFVVALAL